MAVETQKNWNAAVAGWNTSVHYWLKYYVMLPLMDKSVPRGKMQIKPMLATFLASALWHGCLELGFWVMFIGMFF